LIRAKLIQIVIKTVSFQGSTVSDIISPLAHIVPQIALPRLHCIFGGYRSCIDESDANTKKDTRPNKPEIMGDALLE
jgi:hypothetical protein